MFIFDGKPLSPDNCFTDPTTGIQYPANWLRLSSPDDRAAIGITEAPEPAWYDQRFYWNPDLPKDHQQLVEQWVAQTKQTAGTMLADTGWFIERLNDPSSGKPVPQAVLDRRAEIRALSNTKEDAIVATATTAELAAYITSHDYSNWNPVPVSVPSDDVVSFSNGFTSAGFGF